MKWTKNPSVCPGGKPYFYTSKVEEYGPENWGFYRIIWDRQVLAYALTKDQKYGDRPYHLGFFSTVDDAKRAI